MVFYGNRLLIINELLNETNLLAVETLKKRLEKINSKIDRSGIDRDHLIPLRGGIIEYDKLTKPRRNKPPESFDAVRIAHTADALRLLYAEYPEKDIMRLQNSTYCQNIINKKLLDVVKGDWSYRKESDLKYDDLQEETFGLFYLKDRELQRLLKTSPSALKKALNPPADKKHFVEQMLISYILDVRTYNLPVSLSIDMKIVVIDKGDRIIKQVGEIINIRPPEPTLILDIDLSDPVDWMVRWT